MGQSRNYSNGWNDHPRKTSRARWILRGIKLTFLVIIISFVWWKYTCHRAYSEYDGLTKNKPGIISGIFNMFTPEDERPRDE